MTNTLSKNSLYKHANSVTASNSQSQRGTRGANKEMVFLELTFECAMITYFFPQEHVLNVNPKQLEMAEDRFQGSLKLTIVRVLSTLRFLTFGRLGWHPD